MQFPHVKQILHHSDDKLTFNMKYSLQHTVKKIKFYCIDRLTLKNYTISRCFSNIPREHTNERQASGKVANGSNSVTKGHVILSFYADMEPSSSAFENGAFLPITHAGYNSEVSG